MFDPVTMKKYSINSNQYFNFENDFTIIPFKEHETFFTINDIYKEEVSFNQNISLADIDVKFARVDVSRDSDGKEMCGTTHLGHILKHGDQVVGYDLESLNSNIELDNVKNQKYLPDFILIRKFYPKRQRIWKLKRLDVEEGELEKKKKKKELE